MSSTCGSSAEIAANAESAAHYVATHPGLAVFVIAVAALAAWRSRSARSAWRLAWMAVFFWGAAVCAAYVGTRVFLNTMFGSGDCIGMPWLMMAPAIVLAALAVALVLGLGLWIGFVPVIRHARRSRLAGPVHRGQGGQGP